MKNIKTVPMPKKDVERLTKEELKTLVDWSTHDGFKVVKELASHSISNLIDESSRNTDIDAKTAKDLLSGMAYMRQALDYLLDASARAKQELKGRA